MNYYSNYYGSILDPLHGDIKLSEIEKWIISQPIYSRLRNIKQNSFLYYVFPSANHTRFEHSIGVMHLASRIYDSCIENYATGKKKNEKNRRSEIKSFHNIKEIGNREPTFYQELRLAALLHDIGHGPLSHLFDDFSMSKGDFLKAIEKDERYQKYYDGFSKLIAANKVEHELISCAFIIDLIEKIKTISGENKYKFSEETQAIIKDLSTDNIVRMIEPNFEGINDIMGDDGKNYTKFFSNIVTGFPIDADRMDYLLRDSYFSGVTYGIYDINRIFASFIPTINGENISLTYKESGLDSMLRFIQSRTHLYNQVYFHKTNRSANAMLAYGTDKSKRANKKVISRINNIEELQEFYIQNSDEYFIKNTLKNEICQDDTDKAIIEELINRRLFKRIFEKKIVFARIKKDELQKLKAKISTIRNQANDKLKTLEASNIFSSVDIYWNETFKDGGEKSLLIAQKQETDYGTSNNWETINKEFELSDLNILMVRIYLRRTFNNPAQFEEYSRKAKETIQSEIDEIQKVNKE